MIPIVVGPDREEGTRLRDAINAAGLHSEIVSSSDANRKQSRVVVSHVDELPTVLPNFPSVLAFGGRDRASDALDWIRRGVVDYLPIGIDEQAAVSAVRTEYARTEQGPETAVIVSAAIQNIFDLAARVARTDISVLIGGESGTGKEVLARYLHNASPRALGPFIAVNCAAIPETMLEAMLFGHEKGAFTGANDKRLGKFELAHGGTLLLDEVTEMPMSLQAKLLRVLQEREIERLGGHRVIKVDVRVVATSNRDLLTAVQDGALREDLYYRLSVFPLVLPSLKERVDDIVPLARHFLSKHGGRRRLALSESAIQTLKAHTWPGNVRELENAIQRAIVMTHAAAIEPEDLGLDESTTRLVSNSLCDKVRDAEEDHLLAVLAAHGGARKDTAEALGISERTLRYKLKRLKDRGLL